MNAIDQLQSMIADNPQHLATATVEAEKMYKANGDNAAIRCGFNELYAALVARHPLTRPASTEVPDAAWDDDNHPYWSTDARTVWDSEFCALSMERGSAVAQLVVWEMQQAGADLI